MTIEYPIISQDAAGVVTRALPARTPSSHTHGNISNAGAIGTTADLPISTTASGVLAARTVADFRALLGLATTDSPTFAGVALGDGSAASPSLRWSVANTGFYFTAPNDLRLAIAGFNVYGWEGGGNVNIRSTGGILFKNGGDPLGTTDLSLFRDAAGILAQRNGTNGQISRIYNTFTSSTNLRALQIDCTDTNNIRIGSLVGSLGGTALGLQFGTTNAAGTWTSWLGIDTSGNITASGTVTVNGLATLGTDLTGAANLRGGAYTSAGGVIGIGLGWASAGTLGVVSDGSIGFTNITTDGRGGLVTRISQSSAGVLQIGTTANNALGSLNLANITASGTLTLGTSGILVGGTNLVEQRNGTNGQVARWYKTFVDNNTREYFEIDCATSPDNIDLAVCGGLSSGARGLRIGSKYVGSASLTTWLTINSAGAATFINPVSINSNGGLRINSGSSTQGGVISAGSNGFQTIQFGSTTYNSNGLFSIADGSAIGLRSGGGFYWRNGNNPVGGTVVLSLIGTSNLLEQRNGTNGQISRIYKTFTSATNFETFEIDAASDASNYRIGHRTGSLNNTTRGLQLGRYDAAGAWTSWLSLDTFGQATILSNIATFGGLRLWEATNFGHSISHNNSIDTFELRRHQNDATGVVVMSVSRFSNTVTFDLASGAFNLNNLPTSVTPSTNGQFSIEMTSDTAGNLVYRGSDGTTRRMALTFT